MEGGLNHLFDYMVQVFLYLLMVLLQIFWEIIFFPRCVILHSINEDTRKGTPRKGR